MTNVALLIPVLGRPQRVVPLVESVQAAHPLGNAQMMFICNRDDHPQIRAVQDAGVVPLIVPWSAGSGDYSRKMNHAYRLVVKEGKCEWAFLGADDIVFRPGWFEAALRAHRLTNACVIGTNDLGNQRVMRGNHSTHTLVHRDYLECGTIDEDDKILHEGYDHNYCNPPEAPIWMSDLSFRPLGEVRVGDSVIGWTYTTTDSPTVGSPRRRLAHSTVQAVAWREAPLVRVTLESGRTLRCTADHRWLNGVWSPSSKTSPQWVTPQPGRQLVHIVSPTDDVPPSLARTAGYLAGIYDGDDSRLDRADIGGARFGSRDRIVEVKDAGRGQVISMTTSTGNYVAWGYASRNCDDEFVQTAKRRGTFAHARDSYVEHLHPDWKKGTMDATYTKGKAKFSQDGDLYRQRNHLWMR